MQHKKPIISLIVAIAQNSVIGKNNTLPWHLPEDLKRFKTLTMGHHIIMGRKTYESLGRLLPGRTTVIVTRNQNYLVAGALIAYSLADAVAQCAGDDEVFVIGGAELYQQALLMADKLYLTKIAADFDGDAFFPDINLGQWQQVYDSGELSSVTAHGVLNYCYLTYTKAH